MRAPPSKRGKGRCRDAVSQIASGETKAAGAGPEIPPPAVPALQTAHWGVLYVNRGESVPGWNAGLAGLVVALVAGAERMRT